MTLAALNNRWQLLAGKIDALTTRERVVVMVLSLAVIYMVWDFVIFNPLAVAKAKVDKDLTVVEQKINSMKQEEQAILIAVNADPDRELKQQVSLLENQITDLDQALAKLSLGLVPVNQLTEILYNVLQSTGQLQLQSLQTLPVEEIALRSETISEETNAVAGAGVFKHRVLLTVKGDYRQLLIYLRYLEQMDWRFYWDELRFIEDQYPNALIELKVYTLSTDEGLFGV